MTINRILTDTDRHNLQSIIDRMYKLLPMSGHKIQDAMVQEAFVYSTAITLLKRNARILAAGSFHDVAAELLRYDGLAVYDVDPVVNYDLHTFVQLEDQSNKYDAIISTSVLEHTINDIEFVADCCKLLKSGGIGIFTMDFKNDYKLGDPIPYTSNRFYTRNDLETRLRSLLIANDCDLVSEPDYTDKDRFIWDGINYSFATWVFKKS